MALSICEHHQMPAPIQQIIIQRRVISVDVRLNVLFAEVLARVINIITEVGITKSSRSDSLVRPRLASAHGPLPAEPSAGRTENEAAEDKMGIIEMNQSTENEKSR